jgi:cyclopropane fatty-acyl-phospholipid synthase-like methyltransferase
MTDWQRYWNDPLRVIKETDFLRQVGKTVDGMPVSTEQLKCSVRQLCEGLNITSNDRVIDFCCGNGILTCMVASYCATMVGVDYSGPLIEIAKKYHQPFNVRYIHSSVENLTQDVLASFGLFTKAYMCEALQFFNEENLAHFLQMVRGILTKKILLYLGGVPDKRCIWLFYNTPERCKEYCQAHAEGKEAIGTWWDRQVLESIANAEGFSCKFIEQHKSLYSAHYRFDVLLTVGNF